MMPIPEDTATWYRAVVGDPTIEVDPFAWAVRRFREHYGSGSTARMLTRLEGNGGVHCVAVAYLSPAAAALAAELDGRPTCAPVGSDFTVHTPD
jgi:hypothetical protein